MNRALLAALVLLPLLLLGCTGPDALGGGGGDPKALPRLRMRSSSLNVGEYTIDVSPEGSMVVNERRGTTDTAVRTSKMQLTAAQIQIVQAAFKGWKKLNPDYPGDWSNFVTITYDEYTVTAHDLLQAPKQFTDVMATLNNLAKQAVATSTTQPASATAPAN